MKNKKGFTLIELLVVISIIGVLSSVVLASLNTARAKARDAKRKQDMRTISTALQLYYDKFGTMPINQTPCCGYPDTSPNFLQELVTSGFLPSVPKSPNPSYPYRYYNYGAGSAAGAIIVTELESEPISTGYPGTCRPFAAGTNWCDTTASTYYCLCNTY
jgi:prepilin-type N-terminal cleavage/methylation domain-containing protein